jgi:hypothetical protein
MSTRSGAALMPQLPATTVVTPCDTLNGICACDSTAWSSCVCESMKPGATMRPVASSVRRPCGPRACRWRRCGRPTMPTSASKRGALVPSMTVPPRISRS